MNNQSLILLTVGVFVALIVTVATFDQIWLRENPPTEVEGLLERMEKAFERIQDLEATLKVTNESQPSEYLRMTLRYVKGPPEALSMRYLPLMDAREDLFITEARGEIFTVKNNQLFHYIPRENAIVSKRWPGVPLVTVGLGVFDTSQLKSEWLEGNTEIKILQNISGFSGIPFMTSLSVLDSFSTTSAVPFAHFSVQEVASSQSYTLCFSFCPNIQVEEPQVSLGLAQSLFAESESSLSGNHVIEVRDSHTKDLLRMIWIDRETYLIQKVVTFKNGQRSATLFVELVAINQGLTEAEVIAPTTDDNIPLPQTGVENIRG